MTHTAFPILYTNCNHHVMRVHGLLGSREGRGKKTNRYKKLFRRLIGIAL